MGSPIANRKQPEIEGLIGFFVNTLVLRADWLAGPADASFLAPARRARGRRPLAAYAHQDVPFERLVEELQAERSLATRRSSR